MASLTIPDPIIEGLRIIATLNEESFKELVSVLEGFPLKIRPNRIFDDSEFRLETVSEQDKATIRDALVPLFVARLSTNVPIPTFIGDVIQSLRHDNSGENPVQFFESLEPRLTALMSIEKLNLIAKAHDVLTEHFQTYGKARVISDIRPVFKEDVQQGIAAAVIVHMLNITYYQAGERKEFVVALDSKDVEQLIESLKRAANKGKTLETIINSTDTPYIEVV